MWPFKKKKTKSQILSECSSQELMDLIKHKKDRFELYTNNLISLLDRMDFSNSFEHDVTRFELKRQIRKTLLSGDLKEAMDGLGEKVVHNDGPFREKAILIEGSEWREILIKQGSLAHKQELEARGLDSTKKYARL